MIKGWRLDPRWVEYYAKRDNDRIAREIERIRLKYELEQSRIDAEAAARKLRCGRPTAWECGYA